MSTSKWHSSLANLESRIRRGLGVAGPIGLTLSDPPVLTPVVIMDDLTKPGAAGTDTRGRRWAAIHGSATIAAGQRGCVWIVAGGLTSPSKDGNSHGGVIVDWVEISWLGGANESVQTYINIYPPFTAHPGVSVSGNAYMCDPVGQMGIPGNLEVAPVQGGGINNVFGGGAGIAIFQQPIRNMPGGATGPYRVPVDVYLREQSLLVVGNQVNASTTEDLFVTFRGRVF